VNTEGNRVVDIFYVTELDETKLASHAHRAGRRSSRPRLPARRRRGVPESVLSSEFHSKQPGCLQLEPYSAAWPVEPRVSKAGVAVDDSVL
jgi:hypothetical protein